MKWLINNRLHTTGNRRDRERPYAGQRTVGPSTVQVYAKAIRQIQGRPGPRGDPSSKEVGTHCTPRGSSLSSPKREGRGSGVERRPAFPGSHRRRGESRSPPDRARVEAWGHHLGRRLSARQRRGGGGLRVVDTRAVGPLTLPPRLEQRGRRCGDMRDDHVVGPNHDRHLGETIGYGTTRSRNDMSRRRRSTAKLPEY